MPRMCDRGAGMQEDIAENALLWSYALPSHHWILSWFIEKHGVDEMSIEDTASKKCWTISTRRVRKGCTEMLFTSSESWERFGNFTRIRSLPCLSPLLVIWATSTCIHALISILNYLSESEDNGDGTISKQLFLCNLKKNSNQLHNNFVKTNKQIIQ